MATPDGVNEYSFALSYGAPERFVFTEQRLRFSRVDTGVQAPWQSIGSEHTVAKIHSASQGDLPDVNPTMARVIRRVAPGLRDVPVPRHVCQIQREATLECVRQWRACAQTSFTSQRVLDGPRSAANPVRLECVQANVRRVLHELRSLSTSKMRTDASS